MRRTTVIFAASMAMLSITGNAAAETAGYMPMLREGRVWLYASRMPNHPWRPAQHAYNEKNYVVAVRERTAINNKNCWIIDVSAYDTDFSYILHEENGRITRLVENEDGSYSEVPVIDMNLEAGDRFAISSDAPDRVVTLAEHITLSGSKAKRIGFEDTHNALSAYEWVEGIGCLTGFPYAELPGARPDLPVATSPREYLMQVSDNGTLTYTSADFIPEFADRLQPGTVRTDRIWVYGGKTADGGLFKSYCRFDNEPQLINNLHYTPFREFRRVTWPDAANRNDSIVTDGGSFPAALMREDAGVTYLHTGGTPDFSNPDGECAVYFFSALDPLLDGDFAHNNIFLPLPMALSADFSHIADIQQQYRHPATVNEAFINGEKTRYYTIPGYSYMDNGSEIAIQPTVVEGCGLTSMGYLPFALDPDAFPESPALRLLDYCDGDGNILHSFSTLDDVAAFDCSIEDFLTMEYGIWPDRTEPLALSPQGSETLADAAGNNREYGLFGIFPTSWGWNAGSQPLLPVRNDHDAVYAYFKEGVTGQDNAGSTVTLPAGEYLIYDFSAAPGESFNTVITRYDAFPAVAERHTVRVLGKRSLPILGKDRRVMHLIAEDMEESCEFVVVEGIGIVDGSGLYAQPLAGDPNGSGMQNRQPPLFSAAADKEGNSISFLELGLKTGRLFDKEARWEYYSTDGGRKELLYMGFEGTQTVRNMTYDRFYTMKSVSFDGGSGSPEINEYAEPAGDYWLVRESLGEVFARKGDASGCISDEYKVYDFALLPGQKEMLNPFAASGRYADDAGVETLTRAGKAEDVKSYGYAGVDAKIVYRVGIDGRNGGILPEPSYIRIAENENPDAGTSLSRVLDAPDSALDLGSLPGAPTLYISDTYDREVRELLEAAGIDRIASADEAAIEYYSLQGVRIDNPAKGELVIRRHKGRAEKVIIR